MSAMQKHVIRYSIIIGVILFVFSGVLLMRQSMQDPQSVFRAMLANNLRTQGVTRSVSQDVSGQAIRQTLQLHVGEENFVTGETVLTQGTEDSGTTIVTESIGTPTSEYIRYSSIDTDQTGENGQPLDFSKVIDVWARTGSQADLVSAGDLFSESVLGVVPTGMLSTAQRDDMLRLMDELQVYETDFSKVERNIVEGRPVYSYQVTVQPEKYITMLQQFGKLINVTQLDDLNPSDYAQSAPLNLVLEVDVWSRQLTSAQFADTQRIERFSGYGLQDTVDIPEEAITVEELQARLQSVQ